MANEALTYPTWAARTFDKYLAPVLTPLRECELFEKTWLDSCGPGDRGAARFRLFPGSLCLLWVEAMGGSISEECACVAAALECLHNASLHHDDALDEHNSRRGVETVRQSAGASGSILAGDGLFGAACELLATQTGPHAGRGIALLGRAWARMNRGQWMDEPAVWDRVPISEQERHWTRMSRHKLALGNVAGPLAALCTGRDEASAPLASLHEDFSLVSQIMNDLGDRYGFAGFHVVARCSRDRDHEGRRKPNIDTIWRAEAARQKRTGARLDDWLLERAAARVRDRTGAALAALRRLEWRAGDSEVLLDFFTRPAAEFERAMIGIQAR